MEGQVALMSLDLNAVRQAQRLAPSIPVGYLSAVGLGSLSRLEIDFLAVSTKAASTALLRNARSQGIPVYVWTVNNTGTMLDMMERGVDGLITDDSAMAVRVIGDVQALLPVERLLLRFRRFWGVFAGPEARMSMNALQSD
jgi:glycerophosphoryl diester phosphodiesterase